MPGDPAERIQSRALTFFLSGFYGQGNLGDDLLLRATIEGLRRIAPVQGFVIRNENEIGWLKDMPIPVMLTGIDKIAADQTKSKMHRLFLTLLAYKRHFKKCDWFVFGGGTVFHERTSIGPLFMIFLICLLARAMQVRVAALGVGVATLRSTAGRALLRWIIFLSDVFAVRDDAAMTECVKAGAGNRVILTGDLVFDISSQLRGTMRPRVAGSPIVGITVNSPSLLSLNGGGIASTLGAALQTLLARDWRVVLLVFHHQDGGPSRLDVAALAQLAVGLPEKYQAQLSQKVLKADDMEGIHNTFSNIDVHCGMRFHGHVLSAIFGKPFVGISVDNKIDAICRQFEMPVLHVSKLSADDLVRAIDNAMTGRVDPAQRAVCEAGAQKNISQLALRLSGAVGARTNARRSL